MLYDILKDAEFAAIMKNHATDIINYLFEKNEEFGVLVDIKKVSFNPALPQELSQSFAEFTLFLLKNYTYESAKLENGKLEFEAGFGPQNIGSVVSVPLDAILQIIVDETPIFVNLTATIVQESSGEEKSMEALLSNPDNKKFLKK